MAAGMLGKNVEDQRRSIDHAAAQLVLERLLGARRQLVVGHDHVDRLYGRALLYLLELARAHVVAGVEMVEPLGDRVHRLQSRSSTQCSQLQQRGIGVPGRLGRLDRNQERPEGTACGRRDQPALANGSAVAGWGEEHGLEALVLLRLFDQWLGLGWTTLLWVCRGLSNWA